MLAACTGGDPERLTEEYDSYGALKGDVATAVVEMLRPLRKRHAELAADPSYVDEVLRRGAERARGLARPRVDAAFRAVGLLG
ncbi:tryptophanyl-tRNA synthetase [Streptomyces sp. NBRC 110611]|nr:tryptophanyl-tRNA synthetase [Streptomyces sp. NBRC 110611]